MTSDIRTGIKTKEEYMEAATISYVPTILALPKLQAFDLSHDKITFKEQIIEDDSVIPSFATAEMTEVNAAKVGQTSHSFNAYAKVLKLRKDLRKNGAANVQVFHDQILRQFNIQFDRIAFVGEGGNNSLINSSDPNYVTLTSAQIPAVVDDGFNQVQKAKEIATALNIEVNNRTSSSDLTVFFYGAALLAFLGKITPGQENDIRFHIRQAFADKNVNFVEISSLALPSEVESGNGIVVVSNDLTAVQHCGLPVIENDGVNEENGYYFANYRLGSVQIRPEIKGAVIKQVITFA